MRKKLTDIQKETLQFIIDFFKEKQYTPTLTEISKKYGISLRAAYDRVQALIRKDYLTREPGARTLTIKREYLGDDFMIPILGQISAGLPLESPENIESYLPISPDYFPAGEYFALKVRGDSMINAGIYEGDIIIVKKQNFAKNKDIIVAMVDGETTVKRVLFERDMVILKPENENYPLIRKKYVNILGKVIALLRSFK